MNKNGSSTVQISSDLAKKIAILAINNNKTRRQMLDLIIEDFLNKNEGDNFEENN